MDLLQGELEHFIMYDEETMRQMYDKLMVLVRTLDLLEGRSGKIRR
jgi:hypothetical protein